MPATSIFFLPAVPGAAEGFLPSELIFNNLVAEHHLEPLPAWTLEHRLFRETQHAAVTDQRPAAAASTGYLQVLTVSFHSARTYAGISKSQVAGATSKAGEAALGPATMITIPAGPGGEEFTQLLVSRFGPLWTRRQVLQVSNGQAYEVGDFVVRFGEVREIRQGQGGVQHIRGTVAQITWAGDEVDISTAEASIREFWNELQIPGAKEFTKVAGLDLGFGEVRQWLEVMRLRA